MCGRYTNTKQLAELEKIVRFIIRNGAWPEGPRYNIAPTQLAPVIYMEKTGPALKQMRWGLIPAWAKDESTGNALINARSDSLKKRAAFREAYQQRRCLIPADSFYEWQEREGKRQPFRIMFKSGAPFCFAGLWERWIRPTTAGQPDSDLDEADQVSGLSVSASQCVESFAIITTQANKTIAPLHHRMPVILQPEHYGWWLDNKPGHGLFE